MSEVINSFVVFWGNYSRKLHAFFILVTQGKRRGGKLRGYCIENVSTSSYKLLWEIVSKTEIAKLEYTWSELCKSHLHFHYTV